MKNYKGIKEGKRLVDIAFTKAIKEKNALKTLFLMHLNHECGGDASNGSVESYGDVVFDEAFEKATQKAIYKFQDINEDYNVQIEGSTFDNDVCPESGIYNNYKVETVVLRTYTPYDLDEMLGLAVVKTFMKDFQIKDGDKWTDGTKSEYGINRLITRSDVLDFGLFDSELVYYEQDIQNNKMNLTIELA